MDKAPDFGSGDCRFESCHGRYNNFFSLPNKGEIPQVKYRDIKPDEDLYEVMGMGSSKKDASAFERQGSILFLSLFF